MSPGGHLLTTAAACAATAALAPSWPLILGVAVGGFLIDVDHVVDYVLVERQRDLRPDVFLRYYLEGRTRRLVLALHSYELFALLAAVAWLTDAQALWGYLLGAAMHVALDICFNGKFTPHSIGAFYSFAYRLSRGFDSRRLLGAEPLTTPRAFWSAFFMGAISERSAAPPPTAGDHATLETR